MDFIFIGFRHLSDWRFQAKFQISKIPEKVEAKVLLSCYFFNGDFDSGNGI
jgi:hypothetical protein